MSVRNNPVCQLISLIAMLALSGVSLADNSMQPARLDLGKKPLTTLLSHPPLESLKEDYILAIEFRADVTASGKIRKYQPLYLKHRHLDADGTEANEHGCICPYDIADALEKAIKRARVSPARVDGKAVRAGIVATAIFEYSDGERFENLVAHTEGLDALSDASLMAPQIIGGWVPFLDRAERPRLQSGGRMPADHPHFHVRTLLSTRIENDGTVASVKAVYDDDVTLHWQESLIKAFSSLNLIPAMRNEVFVGRDVQIPVTTRFTRRSGHATADDVRFLDPLLGNSIDYEQRLKDQVLHRRLESRGVVTR